MKGTLEFVRAIHVTIVLFVYSFRQRIRWVQEKIDSDIRGGKLDDHSVTVRSCECACVQRILTYITSL